MLYNEIMMPAVDDLLLIDRLADEFESAWLNGERPGIAGYLERVPLARRTEALSELTLIDVEYRRRKGESPSFLEYQRAFPDYFGGARPPEAEARHADNPGSLGPAPGAGEQTEFRRVGRYFVLSSLPSDGQADALLAVHPLGIQVVLKFLRSDLPREQETLIVDEARALAQLRHPRIAHVLDLDYHEGKPFAAIGYIHGQTLDQHAKQRKLGHREVARLMADMARALAAAHRAGVAHLDLKPRNVIVDAHGAPHLIDFGAARIFNSRRDDTDVGDYLVGTAPFMSPEQAHGRMEAVNARSDIFGLGALLYCLLSGRAPFAASCAHAALLKARDGQYPPLPRNVPRALRRVCYQAMDADPDQRQSDAESFAAQLDAFVARPSTRRHALLLSVGLLVVGLTVTVGWLAVPGPDRTPKTDPVLQIDYLQDGQLIAIDAADTHYLATPFRITVNPPPGEQTSLFLLDADGSVQRLEPGDAADGDRKLTYPSETTFLLAEGPAGNRTLLCLTSNRSLPGEADVRLLLDGTQWPPPPLPDGIVVCATGTSVETLYATRIKSLTVTDDNTPDRPTRAFLEHLRKGAAKKGFGFAALTAGFRAREVPPADPEIHSK